MQSHPDSNPLFADGVSRETREFLVSRYEALAVPLLAEAAESVRERFAPDMPPLAPRHFAEALARREVREAFKGLPPAPAGPPLPPRLARFLSLLREGQPPAVAFLMCSPHIKLTPAQRAAVTGECAAMIRPSGAA